jgi:hypothetical protein
MFVMSWEGVARVERDLRGRLLWLKVRRCRVAFPATGRWGRYRRWRGYGG